MELFSIDQNKCNLCYACVRICPVKAIRISSSEGTLQVDQGRCIGCGSCISVCGPDAIHYHNSIPETNKLLESDEKVAAIIDPSISGEFPDITDYRKFAGMIRNLRFDYVFDCSFGVDLVGKAYGRLFSEFKGKYYIMANCPAVVSYIEKYYPVLLDNLSPLVSPMIAMAKVVRKMYGENLRIVFIGPCIATKTEALQYQDEGKIDAVLTFKELRTLFGAKNIREETIEYSDFDPPKGYKGSLYPISRGILEAGEIQRDVLTRKVVTAEGKANMIEAVREFEKYTNLVQSHFNIFYDEGCIMGPGMSPNGEKYLRRTRVIEYTNKRLKEIDKNAWDNNMKEFSKLSLTRTFRTDDQRLPLPENKELENIMANLYKTIDSRELGCNACGFESCKDFAVSIAQGLAIPDMCLSYTVKNKQEYIKNLKISNEKLAHTQTALKESENKARQEQQSAREASEIVKSMLQKLPSSVVIVDKDLKIIQANLSFIELLGDEAKSIADVIPGLEGADIKAFMPYSVYNLFSYVINENKEILNRDIHFEDKLFNISIFPIKRNRIVGAVLRDLYIPEIRREEVIKKVTEVIDNNLSMVQKIGFLLGEGAAETEKMLNSIIESHQAPKSKDTPPGL